MVRYYHLRYERSKTDAEGTKASLTRHLKQFGLPSEVKIKPRPELVTHGIKYQILTRATPKQIDLLHDLLNRDVKWDRRSVVSKSDIKGEEDPEFRKHLSKLHRQTTKTFKATQKKFKEDMTRRASMRRR